MQARLNALFVTVMIVMLSVALPAYSQQPSDSGFQADQESDLNGPISHLSNGKPDLTGVWDRPYVRDIT